ncbi:MAG: ATP synthase F1 subunit gamma [Chitinophagaceae bacterium]|nr:MAG: ATP synthase F1 subunit gamma [Bacteroidetes bacterium OLB11]MCC6448091.1 ATP synthase F1 subunit gamma [Chitinophagaceae bacterium]HMN32765.1 ATP synthase F1 subunit gamma [Chitinophagaceae bacterium]
MSGQLKEVRLRIKSVGTTQQITKAMKMVSAAKLRRAQDAILQMRPYTEKLQEMLSNIIGSVEGNLADGLNIQRPIEKVLFVVITSDRGLCGAFNSNVIKLTKSIIQEKYQAQHAKGNVSIMPIGKKGFENFERNGYPLIDQFWGIFSDLSFDKVRGAAEYIRNAFTNKEFDRIELIYNQFKNAATQQLVCEQYLPIQKTETKQSSNIDFIFEPSKEILITELIPKILNTQLYKGVLDSNASEHGARMTAMDKATENAEEMLRSLRISYNRARQAAITTELTEIVSGAAALNG